MEQFKVDTSTARCRVDGVEAKTERDGRPVLDKASGLQKFVVHLSVRDGDRVRPDQWTVTMAGEPKITVDSYVTLRGLVAYPWEHEGRHGISLRAEAIVPVQSPAFQSWPRMCLRHCGCVTTWRMPFGASVRTTSVVRMVALG